MLEVINYIQKIYIKIMKIETYIFKENYTGLLEGGISRMVVKHELESIKELANKVIRDLEPYIHFEGDLGEVPIPKYTHIVYLTASQVPVEGDYFCGSHGILIFFSKENKFAKKSEINALIKTIGWKNIGQNFDY